MKTQLHKLYKSSTKNKTKKQILHSPIILSEVKDDSTYAHFKSLLRGSTGLCKGRTSTGKTYKVHIALSKNYATLRDKTNHYKLLYFHDNHRVLAYISVHLYKRDGGFMFIHKVCSTGGGYGTQLMKIILADARKNYQQLGITYLSLTTHNLDLINYYNQFKPTRVNIIDNPGSKAQIPKKVAYMIWQLSPDMPNLDYNFSGIVYCHRV